MIECPQCHSVLKKEFINNSVFFPCPQCLRPTQAFVFPALFQKPKIPEAPQPLIIEAQANCFYHPDKKAAIVCSSCGRFLCSLCDIEFDQNNHVCASCLQSGARKKRIPNVDSEAICYDKIAFAVAAYPILIWFVTFITAPAAIFLSLRYWNTKSMTGSKARFIFAIIFALVQIFLWFFVINGIRKAHLNHRHPLGGSSYSSGPKDSTKNNSNEKIEPLKGYLQRHPWIKDNT